jgi:hypothetical protein
MQDTIRCNRRRRLRRLNKISTRVAKLKEITMNNPRGY